MSKENPITIGLCEIEEIFSQMNAEQPNKPVSLVDLWREIGQRAVDQDNNTEEVVLSLSMVAKTIIQNTLELDQNAKPDLYLAAISGIKSGWAKIKEIDPTRAWKVIQ